MINVNLGLSARTRVHSREKALYVAVDKDLRKTIVRMSKRARRRAPPKDERDYFYICEECGQAVDKRSTAQIFHHEELSHLPITEAELTELCLTERAWAKSRRGRAKKP